jgi:transposase
MYIRLKSSKKAKYPTLQIVKGIREGNKVRQQTIAHLGVIKGQEDLKKLSQLAEKLMQRLEKEGLEIDYKVQVKNLMHQKTIYDGFSLIVDRLMTFTGFSKIVKNLQGKNSFDLENIIQLLIAQRIDKPSSKLRTCERQQDHGFCNIELQHIYRAMDAIEPCSLSIQEQAYQTVCAYSDTPVTCVFFDVTTLYFESITQDDLRDFGFSKDQKHHQVQIVLALVATSEGIPIAYEPFVGNFSETKTLLPVLQRLRERFCITNVTVVCDRGLASNQNITALQNAEFQFVIATKLRSISKKIKINDLSVYQCLPGQENLPEEDRVLFYTMPHPQYEDTTLIVTYSPSRAQKDKKDRERLLEKLQNKLTDSNEASIKKVISNNGYKKYTSIGEGSTITLREEVIKEDEAWDGFHGIAVSNKANLSIKDALARYRELWHIEEAFRVAKSTLKTRPIYHWKPHRIKTHILLCFMTLFLERFLELLLRKNNFHLTPDRIQYALASVHTIYFSEKGSQKDCKMESTLTEDAEKIFKTLNISTERMAIAK